MKRIIVALLLVCMMLLTSCGESKEKADDNMEIVWVPQYNPVTHVVTMTPMSVPKGE